MEKTELAVQKNELIEEVKNYIVRNHKDINVSDTQMDMCLKLAQEYNLSPLKREIHFVPFYNSVLKRYDLQPVIAYTEYIKKAQATGKLNGWEIEAGVRPEDKEKETKRDMRATVTIYRKDWDHPFKWTVWFSEVAQRNKDGLNPNRKTKPDFMLKKVAIAQGMRLAFPEDLGAMPYEESEARNVIEGKVEKTTQDVVEEVDYNNEDKATITADPRIEETQRGVKMNNLQKLRIDKMGLDEHELFLTWINKKYILKSPADLTDEQIKEMANVIKNYDADHIQEFIKNLEPSK